MLLMKMPGAGKSSIYTMLAVLKLAWHILFGNNHLEATGATVKHKLRGLLV